MQLHFYGESFDLLWWRDLTWTDHFFYRNVRNVYLEKVTKYELDIWGCLGMPQENIRGPLSPLRQE